MEGPPAASASQVPFPVTAPSKKAKRKLACAACRARRIRCEWPPDGAGCIACELAELRCPGEPEPRKRAKKNPDDSHAQPSAGSRIPEGGDPDASQLELGGALTFHLIEAHFLMANPCVPGAPYNLYRDLLNSAGGSSRELEIAAECLCSAFIASAASFSDHSSIVGPGTTEMPTDLPSRTGTTYHDLVGYGPRRRTAVGQLLSRAIELFEESQIKDRPGVESIYTMIAMDQMVTLTTEGGRTSREFIDIAVEHFKAMLDQEQLLNQEQLSTVKGPLAPYLLLLDAQTAAVLNKPLGFNELDVVIYLPMVNFDSITPPNFDPSQLAEHEVGWTNLGTQLAPLSLSLTMLFRTFVSSANANDPSADLDRLWNGITTALQQLDLADTFIHTLPALETTELTDLRQFDLLGLSNGYRRRALLLDFLIHERILDEIQSAGPANTPPLIAAYETSIQRVKRDIGIITQIAQQDVATRCLLYVRRLFEVLEVSTSWTSLRLPTTTPEAAALLVEELGISAVDTNSILNALDLASWSSVVAAEQKKGLVAGLNHLQMSKSDAPPAPLVPMTFDTFRRPQLDLEPLNTVNPFLDQSFNLSQSSSSQMYPGMQMASSYINQPPLPPLSLFELNATTSYGQSSLDTTGFGQPSLGFSQPEPVQQNSFNPTEMGAGMLDESGGLDTFFAGLVANPSPAPNASTADTAIRGLQFEDEMNLSALLGSQPVSFTVSDQAPAPAQVPQQQQQWW